MHSDAVTNSSSDLLSLDVFGVLAVVGLRFEYHSCSMQGFCQNYLNIV